VSLLFSHPSTISLFFSESDRKLLSNLAIEMSGADLPVQQAMDSQDNTLIVQVKSDKTFSSSLCFSFLSPLSPLSSLSLSLFLSLLSFLSLFSILSSLLASFEIPVFAVLPFSSFPLVSARLPPLSSLLSSNLSCLF
jgi:hypothetical protein